MYRKIKYVRDCIDYDMGSYGKKIVILITPDGTIDVQISFKGVHRSTKTATFNPEEYVILCEKLKECIKNAYTVTRYVDNGEDWVYLYHKIGWRKYPRGLGTEDTLNKVGYIVRGFVETYVCEWWLETTHKI